MRNIPPTKEEVRKYAAKLGWDVNEPYQILVEPWGNDDFILMDDTGSDKITVLSDASIMHTAEKPTFLTRDLPNGATVEVNVAGYGHKLTLTVCNPVVLDF